jgi:predicted deacylase
LGLPIGQLAYPLNFSGDRGNFNREFADLGGYVGDQMRRIVQRWSCDRLRRCDLL